MIVGAVIVAVHRHDRDALATFGLEPRLDVALVELNRQTGGGRAVVDHQTTVSPEHPRRTRAVDVEHAGRAEQVRADLDIVGALVGQFGEPVTDDDVGVPGERDLALEPVHAAREVDVAGRDGERVRVVAGQVHRALVRGRHGERPRPDGLRLGGQRRQPDLAVGRSGRAGPPTQVGGVRLG
jgi:hypothetical protein